MPTRHEQADEMVLHDRSRFSPASRAGQGKCSAGYCSWPPLVDERGTGNWRAHCYHHCWDRDALRALFGIPDRKYIYVELDDTMRDVLELAESIVATINQHVPRF